MSGGRTPESASQVSSMQSEVRPRGHGRATGSLARSARVTSGLGPTSFGFLAARASYVATASTRAARAPFGFAEQFDTDNVVFSRGPWPSPSPAASPSIDARVVHATPAGRGRPGRLSGRQAKRVCYTGRGQLL